jgi:hypothetical protein
MSDYLLYYQMAGVKSVYNFDSSENVFSNLWSRHTSTTISSTVKEHVGPPKDQSALSFIIIYNVISASEMCLW